MNMKEFYICAAVFTSKKILVYKDGEFFYANIGGRIHIPILVGDVLECSDIYDQKYVTNIMPRKNIISRKQNGHRQGLASNIDIVFIITSANQDFNIARLERYFFIAKESGAKVCFVLSKTDLNENCNQLIKVLEERFPQCFVAKTSVYDSGSDLLKYWGENETAVFLGSSGVGKSSLINRLMKENLIKTNTIRNSDGKGRHTTTSRHMYVLNDNRKVIDTPGLRSVGISPNADTIAELFPEICELVGKCKFSDCTHTNEPECAIRYAIEQGEIDYDNFLRYLKLNGDEKKRELFLKGKVYEKEAMLKDLKRNNRHKRKNGGR